MEDKKRRIYETVEFIPYGKDDPTPPHVFNTFEYFEVNSSKHNNEHDLVDTSNFDKLINNLCNNKKGMTEYVMNYIAHMFQYPHINPQKIICLKG